MADKKITDLQQISSIIDSVNLPVDDGSQTYRATALQMKNYIFPDGAVTVAKLAAAVAAALVPAGSILPFGGTSAPTGYLLCDGTSYLRADYAGLYTAIGNAYGTADSTHFNVPDLRGQFIRGVDGSASLDPDKAGRTASNTGGNTGNNVGSKQASAMLQHKHNISVVQFTAGSLSTSGGSGFGAISIGATAVNTANTAGNSATSNDGLGAIQNAGTSTETRPTNVYVNFIIKT